MSANPLRGEVAVFLGGEERILRPSFSALIALEQEMGSLLALAQEASEGRVRLEAIVAAIDHCLYLPDGAQRPDRAAIGDWILAAGMMVPLKAYRQLLERVLAGVQPLS